MPLGISWETSAKLSEDEVFKCHVPLQISDQTGRAEGSQAPCPPAGPPAGTSLGPIPRPRLNNFGFPL